MNRTTICLILGLVLGSFLVSCIDAEKVIHMPLHRKPKIREYISRVIAKHPHLPENVNVLATVPLDGSENKLGEYYVNFTLGTPAQKFTTQLDTGSSDLAIPAQSCSTCSPHIDQSYNSKASSTSVNMTCTTRLISCPTCTAGQCSYSISYGDGSGYNASVIQDSIVLGGLKAPQYFGVITSERSGGGNQPFEPYPVDGIMGFAYQTLSEIQAPTPFENFVNTNLISNIFSMCMTDAGGSMTLGGTGGHHTGNYQYTPIIKEDFYTIYLADVKVLGKSLGVSATTYNRPACIVDSGTTFLILPKAAYTSLQSIVSATCSSGSNLVGVCGVTAGQTIFDGYCYSMTAAQVAAYPTIEFVFGQTVSTQITVSISPQSYLQTGLCTRQALYTLAIAPGSLLDGTILGDTFMQNFENVFDRANKRMGFAPVSGCPSAP